MIISASRRTDIPAFYSGWFMNRIRVGYCAVPNPFNPSQVSQVSLTPEDVDVIVFWTRDPRPILPYLDELDQRGHRYYFLFTVMDNPPLLDPKTPPLETSLKSFCRLADRLGPDRVIWRYDPIVFSTITDAPFHMDTFAKIARALQDRTHRCIISLVDVYRKVRKRLDELISQGIEFVSSESELHSRLSELMPSIVDVAGDYGMEIFSCAEETDIQSFGIPPGKCIDDEIIRNCFGREVSRRKDPSQRKRCRCVVSKDIGMYDTCLFGCRYCYAVTSSQRAEANFRRHDPDSPSLL